MERSPSHSLPLPLPLSLSLVLPLYSRELEHYCCLQPPEQGWCSSNPSQFHWLSQQLPIKCYLLGSPKAAEKRQEQRMEGRDEGVRKSWGEEAKRGSRESQMRLFFFFFLLFAAEVQAVFGISISVTKRAGRQGREKQNPGYASHAGPLWSSPGFWQEGCIRRGEGVEAAEWGMRRCFDSLSTPSWLFSPIPSW